MNCGAYQHFLRVSNDYCETSRQWNLEGQGQEGHCSKWPFTRPGASCPHRLWNVPSMSLYASLEMERNKEMTCFQSSRTSANHWGRKEKRERGKKVSGEEGWRRRRGNSRNAGLRVTKVSRDLPLTSTQLPINRPVPVLVP